MTVEPLPTASAELPTGQVQAASVGIVVIRADGRTEDHGTYTTDYTGPTPVTTFEAPEEDTHAEG